LNFNSPEFFSTDFSIILYTQYNQLENSYKEAKQEIVILKLQSSRHDSTLHRTTSELECAGNEGSCLEDQTIDTSNITSSYFKIVF